MAPHLEVPTTTHAKVMIAPPRLNLRRAASYNPTDRGPLSATSSRFNFNHLLFSPPPSPGLPALVTRKRKPSTAKAILTSRPSRVLRLGFYFAFVISTVYLLGYVFKHPDSVPAMWPYFTTEEFEMVGQDRLPEFPTPIVLSDHKGHTKWTISIPPNYAFPLSVAEYAEMSAQCREVSARAQDLHSTAPVPTTVLEEYDAPDSHFVDVHEAEKTGLLPPSRRGIPIKDDGHFVGMPKVDMVGKPVCESSMTFVLESNNAGMGNAMMMLWTFYGLAKEQGRDFFIDDTRWAYGDYADIFRLPPVPKCRPPPRHLIVPCPFQARHLVVSEVSAHEIFPALLATHHKSAGTDDTVRDLWQLARVGYEALFRINIEDNTYVENRIRSMRQKAKTDKASLPDAPVIGLHIRHGDQHPLEFQYRKTYIPAETFQDSVQRLIDAYYNGTDIDDESQRSAITILASDDPTVHQEPEFVSALSAQERIRLASKEYIEQTKTPVHRSLRRFIDEAFGWEGGFFAAMFWNLGVERKNNGANAPEGVEVEDVNEEARFNAPPSEQTLKLRSIVGRAYMMDLAVLAGASDNIVCAVSAMGCRLLGVMMPWEKGVAGNGWVNVDGEYGWTGIDW